MLEKLEKFWRYTIPLTIEVRSKDIMVIIKSTKVTWKKKYFFDHWSTEIDQRMKDVKERIEKRKATKKKTRDKNKIMWVSDYKKKAISAFQAWARYRCAIRDNNSIHRWYCITSWAPTATNARSYKYYKENVQGLKQGNAWHFIRRSVKSLLLDEYNCHLQSSRENKVQGWSSPQEYKDKILEMYWKKELERLIKAEKDRKKTTNKWSSYKPREYKDKYEHYKKELEEVWVYETSSWRFPKCYLNWQKVI